MEHKMKSGMVPKGILKDIIIVVIGDVIVFDRPEGQDRVIVHRVAAILNEDPYTIRTKGDANPASIPGTDFPIYSSSVIGKSVPGIEAGFVSSVVLMV